MGKVQGVYLSHGGGPLPLLGEPSHEKMVTFFKQLPEKLNRPEVILVISAHWETTSPAVIGSAEPGLYYDYYGFPPETYVLNHPLKTDLALVKRLIKIFESEGHTLHPVTNRGYDHGVFIPLMLMYPEADIPVVQLALGHSLKSDEHLALGKILSTLKDESILILGSGFSFHNLKAFRFDEGTTVDSDNDAFQNWLIQTMCHDVNPEEGLLAWDQAPFARYCHPREEHLLPLHVVYGAMQSPAQCIFDDYIAGKRAVMFLWA